MLYMEDLLKPIKKNKTVYLFVFLIILFVTSNIQVPEVLANIIDNPLGQISIYLIALSLFFVNNVLGAVALIGAFELIRRSEKKTGTYQIKRFLPSQTHKDRHLSSFNQFPLTLEEEVVSNMVPLVNEAPIMAPSYKPVLDNLYNASTL